MIVIVFTFDIKHFQALSSFTVKIIRKKNISSFVLHREQRASERDLPYLSTTLAKNETLYRCMMKYIHL